MESTCVSALKQINFNGVILNDRVTTVFSKTIISDLVPDVLLTLPGFP